MILVHSQFQLHLTVVRDQSMCVFYCRREVYKILVREGIAHPRYAVMNRDDDEKGKQKKYYNTVNHLLLAISLVRDFTFPKSIPIYRIYPAVQIIMKISLLQTGKDVL